MGGILPQTSRLALLFKPGIFFLVLAIILAAIIGAARGTTRTNAGLVGAFVRYSGTQFTLNNKPFHVGGVNIHYLSWATPQEVDLALSDAAAMNATVVRTIIGPVRGSLDETTIPTIWNWRRNADSSNLDVHGTYVLYWDTTTNSMAWNDGPDGLQKMDYAIAKAGELNLKLLVALLDFWDYTGGAQQMRAWYGGQDEFSFFFSDPRTRQDYKRWVEHVLNRVNTITGVAYKDDPTIFGWNLMNEPTARSTALAQGWIAEMSAHVKSIDPNHLVSSGAANFRKRMPELAIPSIDFGTWHAYPVNFGMAPQRLNRQINEYCALGRRAAKPVLMEEFAYKNTNRDQAAIYRSWTDTVYKDPNCAGWLIWRLTSRQESGQYPNDHDRYDIHNDNSETARVIKDALLKMASKGQPEQSTPAPAPTETVVAAAPTAPTPSGGYLAPQGDPGKTYHAAFPMTIRLDGNLTEWRRVPQVSVNTGPMPAANPAKDGSVTFAAVADNQNLYFMLRVIDSNIVANKHGAAYWEEDSVEIYINATGDRGLTSYVPGVAQITIPAANIGRPAANAIITGKQYETLGVQARVVKTSTGYAIEAAVPLQTDVWDIKPAQGSTLGFQIQLNGATKTSRDIKLSWSAKDTNDESHENPSVFGELVFFDIQTATPAK
jgi:mannan endo-1,4-beta-mannosidase